MTRRPRSGFLLFVLGLVCAASSAFALQQPQVVSISAVNVPLESLAASAVDARNAPPTPPSATDEVNNFDLAEAMLRTQAAAAPLAADPLLQAFAPSAPTNLLTQFDGSDNVDNGMNVTPPDTNGDVSSDAVDRYVQMINIVTTVFDKSGTELGGGAFPSNAFWQGFGGLCETNNNGDPIVIYDEAAGRWLVSQFAWASTSSPPWLQCIAISQTSDPLGAYNRYAYDFAAVGFNDYPKFGITTDAITMMANLFTPGFAGTFIGTADKQCMYAGGALCSLVGANLGPGEFGFLPADLDDPAGSAGFVPALFGTAMSANGSFDVWEIDPDFVTPANSTITRISRVPIAAFDSDICPNFRERCVPHPGGGDDLETLSGRLMHRLQIRDFGSHLAMVTAHTIDVDAAPAGTAGRSGIRWYELNSFDGGASGSLRQQGTHGPADSLHRWMPSIAMNAAGDIGIGFMVSDATTPPEIRVTGQTSANGGSGAFDGTEAMCRAGVNGADWTGRAGDYGATGVDPDRDTFWHTNEFGARNVFRGWGTAVCEFELTAGPPPPPPPPGGDADNDGVPDTTDLCPNTVIPEGVPTNSLGNNRWALVDGDLNFDTRTPRNRPPSGSYNTTQTGGCSCEQILVEVGGGNGEFRNGCTTRTMDSWVGSVSGSGVSQD